MTYLTRNPRSKESPAEDFNCGWSVLHLLTAMSLSSVRYDEEVGLRPINGEAAEPERISEATGKTVFA